MIVIAYLENKRTLLAKSTSGQLSPVIKKAADVTGFRQ